MQVQNQNLFRRRLPGFALALAYPWLKLFLLAIGLRRRAAPVHPDRVTLFQSYQVGDFYMALPAIHHLARHLPLRVLCRPDCAFLLRDSGIEAVPFANPFPVRPGLRTFLTGLGGALALRSATGPIAFDFYADPRTGFLLKAAGARRVHSFRRPYGWFIDVLHSVPATMLHQSEKDMALAEAFLRTRGLSGGIAGGGAASAVGIDPGIPAGGGRRVASLSGGDSAARARLILSCWTRKEEKNWPLDQWSGLVEALLEAGRQLCVIVPPDGDRAFQDFRARWRDRMEFLETDLEGIHERVRAAEGVICTDNFLGHMGAYLGKPVFWINGSSDPAHVRPYASRTEVVQLEPMPCRPCLHRCVNAVYKQCLNNLSSAYVSGRALAWLKANGI